LNWTENQWSDIQCISHPRYPIMVDWREIIEYLHGQGMRYIDIAVSVDRSESWVCQLKTRDIGQPGYEQGKTLLALAESKGYRPPETADPGEIRLTYAH